jgi:hypothetical protein
VFEIIPQNCHFSPKKARSFLRDVYPLYKNVTVQYHEVPPRAGMRWKDLPECSFIVHNVSWKCSGVEHMFLMQGLIILWTEPAVPITWVIASIWESIILLLCFEERTYHHPDEDPHPMSSNQKHKLDYRGGNIPRNTPLICVCPWWAVQGPPQVHLAPLLRVCPWMQRWQLGLVR